MYLRRPTGSKRIARVTSQRPSTMRMSISTFRMRKQSFGAKSLTQGHMAEMGFEMGACLSLVASCFPKAGSQDRDCAPSPLAPVRTWESHRQNDPPLLRSQANQASGLILASG